MLAVIRKFILFWLLLTPAKLYAQDSVVTSESAWKRKVALQMNMQFTYFNDDHSKYNETLGLNLTIKDNILRFTFKPVVRLSTRKGGFLDLGFEEMYFNVDEDARFEMYDSLAGTTIVTGQKTTSLSIYLRCEYTYIFLKKAKSKIKPALGVSSGLFYRFTANEPAPSNYFNTSYWSLGTTAYAVPGGLFELTNGYLAMSFPVDIGTFALKQNKTDNPALPEKTRKTTTWDYDYWNVFRAQLSYGIYIR